MSAPTSESTVTKVGIGGMFSISQWDNDGERRCSACHAGARRLQLFAVEQTEAMIESIERINESGMLGNATRLVYEVWDTCGDDRDSHCIYAQATETFSSELLATVVGPYYSDTSYSMNNDALKALYNNLGLSQRITNIRIRDRGVWSLLDYPYMYSQDINIGDLRDQLVMLQQTCELQAQAAVDFLEREGWYDVTVIVSNDYCGGRSMVKFDQAVKQSRSYCRFDVNYVQESGNIDWPDYDTERKAIADSEIHTFVHDIEINDALNRPKRRSNLVVLSSFPFALSLFKQMLTVSDTITSVGGIFLGELWGDPRNVDELYSHITRLVHEKNDTVFALRLESNGTEKFQDYMSSITSNSSKLHRNRWLGEYWEGVFKCSLTNKTCNTTDRLPAHNWPILRNYKATLVANAVYATAQYYKDFSTKFPNEAVNEFFEDQIYKLNSLKPLFLPSKWIGNTMTIGQVHQPDLDVIHFDVIQPLTSTYEIIRLQSVDETEMGYELYAKWRLTDPQNETGKLELDEKKLNRTIEMCLTATHTVITSTSSSLSSSGLTQAPGLYNCNDDHLYPMATVVFITLLLLVIVSLIWTSARGKVSHQVVHIVVFSHKKVALIVSTGLSISVSLWIVFSTSATNCETRTADFLVNLVNTSCYSVILLNLASKLFEQPLTKFLVQSIGFILFVTTQASIAAVAHFHLPSERTNKTLLVYCLDERQKPLVVISYFYSVVLLSGCVLLYIIKTCRKKRRQAKTCIKITTAIITASVYVIFVALFVWADASYCDVHTRLFALVSLYPSIVCLVLVTFATVACVYKMREKNRDDIDLPFEVQGMMGSNTGRLIEIFFSIVC